MNARQKARTVRSNLLPPIVSLASASLYLCACSPTVAVLTSDQLVDRGTAQSYLHLKDSYARASAAQEAISTGRSLYTVNGMQFQVRDASSAFKQMASDGFDLADANCLDFFRAEGSRQQWIIFGRDVVGAVGTLATAATAAAGSPTGVIAAFSIVTATGYNGLDIYQRNFLFGADNIDSMGKLVTTTMQKERAAILSNTAPWTSFGQAQTSIMKYQAECMPAAILSVARRALQTSTPEVDSSRSFLDEKQATVSINGGGSASGSNVGKPIGDKPPASRTVTHSIAPVRSPNVKQDPAVTSRKVKLFNAFRKAAADAEKDPGQLATSDLRKMQRAIGAVEIKTISGQQEELVNRVDYRVSVPGIDKITELEKIRKEIVDSTGADISF